MGSAAYTRAWRLKNQEKVVAYNRRTYEKRKNDPEYRARNRDKWLWDSYGITNADYKRLLENQNGKCAICLVAAETQQHRKLLVDHCHSTGIIRGLLCYSYNLSIGHFKNNEELLIKAATYVKESHERANSFKVEVASVDAEALLNTL